MQCLRVVLKIALLRVKIFGRSFNFSAEMNVGQCVKTPACEKISCNQVRQYMPTNLKGMMGLCKAMCCKNGICHELNDDTDSLQLPNFTRPKSTPQWLDGYRRNKPSKAYSSEGWCYYNHLVLSLS